jgi:hypothetical protein
VGEGIWRLLMGVLGGTVTKQTATLLHIACRQISVRYPRYPTLFCLEELKPLPKRWNIFIPLRDSTPKLIKYIVFCNVRELVLSVACNYYFKNFTVRTIFLVRPLSVNESDLLNIGGVTDEV